jgi:subtilase family serine protease
MATDNLARQLSCSWGFDIDVISQQTFLQFAAQGQSFFMASGDSGTFTGPIFQPSDDPYITIVGGTDLTTDSSQAWVSETTWNGSSGGISTIYPIPDWQQGIDMSANQGSATMRNLPDVAMIANNVLAIADNGRSMTLQGTSIAAPLWAGFTALVNERAAASGKPPIGFINPVIYAIGKSPAFASSFHDITTGNNTTKDSPSLFYAVLGYDLCTGWGTPNGTNFINTLLSLPSDGLLISSPLGFTASGPVGGPFNLTSQTYTLTNAGTTTLSGRSLTQQRLTVEPSGGTLSPGS